MEVLVTTGQTVDPAMLGPQPAHVHAARFVPQHDVLAAAAAVVCHAGVGTVYDALSVGVPLVVAPLAADQPICAMADVTRGQCATPLGPVDVYRHLWIWSGGFGSCGRWRGCSSVPRVARAAWWW